MDKDDDSEIPGDLKSEIFKHCVRNGGEKEYERMLQTMRKPPTAQHKTAAMYALTNGSTTELRKRTFDLLLTDQVKTQDIVSQQQRAPSFVLMLEAQMYFIVGASKFSPARRELWHYVRDNFDAIETRFDGNFSLSRVVQYGFETMTSEKDAAEVEAYFKGRE